MVQLKSFRFIEADEPTNDSVDSVATETDTDQSGTTIPTTSSPSTISSSKSSTLTSPSSSQQSIYTVAGGNLTIESGSQLDNDQVESIQTAVEGPTFATATSASGSTSTVLSTNEEYQQTKFDMAVDGDDEIRTLNDKTSTSRQAEPSPGDTATPSQARGLTKRPFQPKSPSPSHNVPKSITPLMARQHLGGANRRPMSPVLAARQARLQGDSISQHSSYRQPIGNNSNHFEIRWHNIQLRARRSKLPRFIAENALYKMLKSKQNPMEADKKIYYSPPLRKRTISVIPEVVAPTATTVNVDPDEFSASTMNSEEFRPILTNISGSVFSGQLTAILGPSGVGKTSLLNSLTGRNTLDGTGRVSLLGANARKRMSVVTVPQADVLPGKLTTIEDLRFTSRLKNPQKGFDHERNIERIVRHLQMEKFLNTRIDKLSGGEQRRLSIGRELLNSPDIMILDEPTSGLDAITCKKIITALRDIVEHSDNILDRPMSIIVTIHQPQQEVLNLFHRLYIMALGGCAIYEGPPSNLLSHLIEHSSLSSVTNVEELNENPAIVAIEVASGEYGPEIISELAHDHEMSASDYYGYYNGAEGGGGGGPNDGQSPYLTPRSLRGGPRKSPAISVRPHKTTASGGGSDGISLGAARSPTLGYKTTSPTAAFDRMSSVTSLSYASTYDADLPEQVSRLKVDKRLRRSVVMKSDLVSQTLTLMRRCWILTTRDTFLMVIRVLGFLLIAGGTVQIYHHALKDEENQCPVYQSEVDDVISFMGTIKTRLSGLQETLKQATSTHTFFFHLSLCTTIVSSALTGLVFPLQMRMFLREYKNGWYSPGAFITSSTIAELPIDIVGPTLTILIVYPLCNQPVSVYYWREIGYILVTIISSLICKSQAQIVGAFLMDSVENSVFISCVMVTPPALLSGIAVRISQMPLLLQYLSYGSFLRYAHESLFLLRYGYGLCPCDPGVVSGYPVVPTENAIPERLDTFARGIMDLSGAGNVSMMMMDSNSTDDLPPNTPIDEFDNSLFVKYIRLVTDASNMFLSNAQELGDCNKYRSLYLLQMDIDDRILDLWFPIMIMIFIISRVLTYFVVKFVIKMRRQ